MIFTATHQQMAGCWLNEYFPKALACSIEQMPDIEPVVHSLQEVGFQLLYTEPYEVYAQRVRNLGVDVKEGRSRLEGEGQSLYFYDYDNHLFELHTGTLTQRLQTYR